MLLLQEALPFRVKDARRLVGRKTVTPSESVFQLHAFDVRQLPISLRNHGIVLIPQRCIVNLL
jgi:hypothetical protein